VNLEHAQGRTFVHRLSYSPVGKKEGRNDATLAWVIVHPGTSPSITGIATGALAGYAVHRLYTKFIERTRTINSGVEVFEKLGKW
jgi:hypothetical protein